MDQGEDRPRRLCRRPALGLAALSAALVAVGADPAARPQAAAATPDRPVELTAELSAAAAEERHLAVFWERRGCRYCAEMNADHLARPAVRDYLQQHFRRLHLDTEGTRQVLDLDGALFDERSLARRWQVALTPTIVFLPDRLPPPMPGYRVAVARMNGLLAPPEFLGLFTYVAEHAYLTGEPFPRWWSRRRPG